MNGISYGLTPMIVKLECGKNIAGRTPPYYVVAYPTAYTFGYSQTRVVDPCLLLQQGYGELTFDMSLKSVDPQNNIDLNVRN